MRPEDRGRHGAWLLGAAVSLLGRARLGGHRCPCCWSCSWLLWPSGGTGVSPPTGRGHARPGFPFDLLSDRTAWSWCWWPHCREATSSRMFSWRSTTSQVFFVPVSLLPYSLSSPRKLGSFLAACAPCQPDPLGLDRISFPRLSWVEAALPSGVSKAVGSRAGADLSDCLPWSRVHLAGSAGLCSARSLP